VGGRLLMTVTDDTTSPAPSRHALSVSAVHRTLTTDFTPVTGLDFCLVKRFGRFRGVVAVGHGSTLTLAEDGSKHSA